MIKFFILDDLINPRSLEPKVKYLLAPLSISLTDIESGLCLFGHEATPLLCFPSLKGNLFLPSNSHEMDDDDAKDRKRPTDCHIKQYRTNVRFLLWLVCQHSTYFLINVIWYWNIDYDALNTILAVRTFGLNISFLG